MLSRIPSRTSSICARRPFSKFPCGDLPRIRAAARRSCAKSSPTLSIKRRGKPHEQGSCQTGEEELCRRRYGRDGVFGLPRECRGHSSWAVDRRSVVEGKSVWGRVDLGGRSVIKKKK